MTRLRSACKLSAHGVGIALLGLLVMFMALSACREQSGVRRESASPTATSPLQGTELPFETIEEHPAGTYYDTFYHGREPRIIILANREDLTALEGLRFKQARSQLELLDYDAYFAVVALRGYLGNLEDEIRIERIVRDVNTVTVRVTLVTAGRGTPAHPIATSKAHVVRVRKVGTWGEAITFNLVADHSIVASTERHIP